MCTSLEDRREWGLDNGNYFEIYFENAKDLLSEFESSLEDSGDNKQDATQHRN